MFAYRKFRRLVLAAVACPVLFVVTAPMAFSAPAYDSQGYIDSTARCTAPATAVVFGRTATARVAICMSSDGKYQYRGVRVRDGAKLIVPASRSSDGAFTAANDGFQYMVTSRALVISSGTRVIRDETMLDFHRRATTTAPSAPAVPRTAAPTTAAPTTAAPTAAAPTAAAPTSVAPTPTTPLPPPLAAEVGGSGS
ncbi:MAG: hypothetical protein K0U78_04195 [Actinomycetia bacterium]|nr:hypothetical protein [Actinomycetes bacterium]